MSAESALLKGELSNLNFPLFSICKQTNKQTFFLKLSKPVEIVCPDYGEK